MTTDKREELLREVREAAEPMPAPSEDAYEIVVDRCYSIGRIWSDEARKYVRWFVWMPVRSGHEVGRGDVKLMRHASPEKRVEYAPTDAARIGTMREELELRKDEVPLVAIDFRSLRVNKTYVTHVPLGKGARSRIVAVAEVDVDFSETGLWLGEVLGANRESEALAKLEKAFESERLATRRQWTETHLLTRVVEMDGVESMMGFMNPMAPMAVASGRAGFPPFAFDLMGQFLGFTHAQLANLPFQPGARNLVAINDGLLPFVGKNLRARPLWVLPEAHPFKTSRVLARFDA